MGSSKYGTTQRYYYGASNGLEIVRSKRQAKHESTTTEQAKLEGIEPSLCIKTYQSLYLAFMLDVILKVRKLFIFFL